MTKHTPGPWAVNPINAQVDELRDGKAIPVCRMLWPTELRGEDETLKNARLIAAAPEMLAALQRLVRDAEITGIDKMAGWDVWFADARAAIAKATEE